MSNLKDQIEQLATSFANSILEAVAHAAVGDLFEDGTKTKVVKAPAARRTKPRRAKVTGKETQRGGRGVAKKPALRKPKKAKGFVSMADVMKKARAARKAGKKRAERAEKK